MHRDHTLSSTLQTRITHFDLRQRTTIDMDQVQVELFDKNNMSPLGLRPGSNLSSVSSSSSVEHPAEPNKSPPSTSAVPVSVIQFARKPYATNTSSPPSPRKAATAPPVLITIDDDGGSVSLSSPTPAMGNELVPSSWSKFSSAPSRETKLMTESELIQREYFLNYLKTMNSYNGPRNSIATFQERHQQHDSRFNSMRQPRPAVSLPSLPWPETPESEWQTVKINFVDPYGYSTKSTNDREVYYQ